MDHHWKVMWLACEVLIQRFLLHELPKGMMRIRHYSFLANACRARQLPRIRQAIAEQQKRSDEDKVESEARAQTALPSWHFPCPCCKQPMRVVVQLKPQRQRWDGG
jgi:transcription elongation factor Elf1